MSRVSHTLAKSLSLKLVLIKTLRENHSSGMEETSHPAFCSNGWNQWTRHSIFSLPKSTSSFVLFGQASTLKTRRSLMTSAVPYFVVDSELEAEFISEPNLSSSPVRHNPMASFTLDWKLPVRTSPLFGLPASDPLQERSWGFPKGVCLWLKM